MVERHRREFAVDSVCRILVVVDEVDDDDNSDDDDVVEMPSARI